MSEFQASNFKKAQGGSAPDIVGKVEFTSPYFFVPPSGNTASRPSSCAPGTIRFNTDVGTLEVYRGDTIGWEYIQRREGQYLGGGSGSNAGLGTRLISGGGNTPAMVNQIDFLTISTLGNAEDFGDLTRASTGAGGSSSRTRGLFTNRRSFPSPGGYFNEIDFVTFASKGDAQDFGDSTVTNGYNRALSNQIRSCGLSYSSVNTINYVTIATTGDAVDFGDQTAVLESGCEGSSTTRGVLAGGGNLKAIDFITIMTTGNAQDFGDLSANVTNGSGLSNSTRAVFKMRFQSGSYSNTLEFITIATTGNSIDFGDSINTSSTVTADASPTRGIFAGGYNPVAGNNNVIQKIEIATTGNALDFGDLNYSADHTTGSSNGHGGL